MWRLVGDGCHAIHPNAPQNICCIPGAIPDSYVLFLLLFKQSMLFIFTYIFPPHFFLKYHIYLWDCFLLPEELF